MVTHWRVWPGDIDAFGHMTNARHQTLMDLARVDFLLRCKLFKGVLRRRWKVPVGLVNLHFRKALKPFERFEIHRRIVHWDERWFYFQQDFYRGGDAARPVVTGYVKTLFASRQGAVPTAEPAASKRPRRTARSTPWPREGCGCWSWRAGPSRRGRTASFTRT